MRPLTAATPDRCTENERSRITPTYREPTLYGFTRMDGWSAQLLHVIRASQSKLGVTVGYSLHIG